MLLLVVLLQNNTTRAAYTAKEWVHNPLGFPYLEMESSKGFIWGTGIVALSVLLGKLIPVKDTTYKASVSFFEEAGFYEGYYRLNTVCIVNNTGAQYRLFKWMSLGAEAYMYSYGDGLNHTLGIGARPFARWYFVHRPKWDMFFEYGAGIIWNIREFPLTTESGNKGTHFNFTPKYGLGVDIHFEERFSATFGVRHIHVSNGFIFGPNRNPAYDANGIYAGIKFNLARFAPPIKPAARKQKRL